MSSQNLSKQNKSKSITCQPNSVSGLKTTREGNILSLLEDAGSNPTLATKYTLQGIKNNN